MTPSLSQPSKPPMNMKMEKIPLKSCRVLIVTPSSESAMHVSGGVGKVILLPKIECSEIQYEVKCRYMDRYLDIYIIFYFRLTKH